MAFLAGPWTLDELVARAVDAIGGRPRGLRKLAALVITSFPQPPIGRLDTLTSFVRTKATVTGVSIRHWHFPEPAMAELLPSLPTLDLPSLRSVGELAEWLAVDVPHLLWLGDPHHRLRQAPTRALRNYRYAWIRKRAGGLRLIEAPKPKLKRLQRQILRQLIDVVPVHPNAHGFCRGRSVSSHALAHVGRPVVVRLDLAEFFTAITEARVRAIFRSLGYPDSVARLLAALCCTPTPADVLSARPRGQTQEHLRESFVQCQQLRASHLAQGAPTSPALANLAAFGLDRRLTALARRWGATYSRYADDLTFSGDLSLSRRATTFNALVAAIASDEGFAVRLRKTRVMPRATRQLVTGIVVNVRPGVRRDEIERLEAILYNCARYGAASQNREQHSDFRAYLAGKVAWAESVGTSSRVCRLRQLFEQIAW